MSLPMQSIGFSPDQTKAYQTSSYYTHMKPAEFSGRLLSQQSPQKLLTSPTSSVGGYGSGYSPETPIKTPIRQVKKTLVKRKKTSKDNTFLMNGTQSYTTKECNNSKKRRGGQVKQINELRKLINPEFKPSRFNPEEELQKLQTKGLHYDVEHMTDFEKNTLFIEKLVNKRELSQIEVLMYVKEAIRLHAVARQLGLNQKLSNGAGQTLETDYVDNSFFRKEDFTELPGCRFRRKAIEEKLEASQPAPLQPDTLEPLVTNPAPIITAQTENEEEALRLIQEWGGDEGTDELAAAVSDGSDFNIDLTADVFQQVIAMPIPVVTAPTVPVEPMQPTELMQPAYQETCPASQNGQARPLNHFDASELDNFALLPYSEMDFSNSLDSGASFFNTTRRLDGRIVFNDLQELPQAK